MLAVTVIGNIGNDAEIKEFNGQKFIAFNVASTEQAGQPTQPYNVG